MYNQCIDAKLCASFTTYFSCQKDCSMSNVFTHSVKAEVVKFGRCDLKFKLKFNLKFDVKSDLVTINSALKHILSCDVIFLVDPAPGRSDCVRVILFEVYDYFLFFY